MLRHAVGSQYTGILSDKDAKESTEHRAMAP